MSPLTGLGRLMDHVFYQDAAPTALARNGAHGVTRPINQTMLDSITVVIAHFANILRRPRLVGRAVLCPPRTWKISRLSKVLTREHDRFHCGFITPDGGQGTGPALPWEGSGVGQMQVEKSTAAS